VLFTGHSTMMALGGLLILHVGSFVGYRLNQKLARQLMKITSSKTALKLWPSVQTARALPPKYVCNTMEAYSLVIAICSSIATGLFLSLLASFALNVELWGGAQSSSEWIRVNSQFADEFTGKPFASIDCGAYILTRSDNPFRRQLVQDLVKYGLPRNKVHMVQGVDGQQCKLQNAQVQTSIFEQALEIVYAVLGRRCNDYCETRCFPSGQFCPTETDPSAYELISCPPPSLDSDAEQHNEVVEGMINRFAESGTAMSQKIFLNVSHTFLGRPAPMVEAAVTASHLSAVRMAYDAGENMALIFEDDASAALVPKWNNMGLAEVLQALPEDWNVIQLHVWLGLPFGTSAFQVNMMRERLAHGHLVSLSFARIWCVFDVSGVLGGSVHP